LSPEALRGSSERRSGDMLHRYWFELSQSNDPNILNTGCGITAFSVEDAKNILESEVFKVYGGRNIINIIENIDISDLDDGVVKPNMKQPTIRGVWFPIM
jgi:hypothetical protein